MLLINDEAIFVHMPRTGGSFTTKVIQSAGIPYKEINYTHGSVSEVYKGLDINPLDYYSFGFVRNPWAWSVSIAFQFGGFGVHGMPVRNFILERHHYLGENSLQQRYIHQFVHDKILKVEVFKLEELKESLNKVFDKFGWNKPKELIEMTPINTKSQLRNPYQSYYNDQLKHIVFLHNKNIIRDYGYSF